MLYVKKTSKSKFPLEYVYLAFALSDLYHSKQSVMHVGWQKSFIPPTAIHLYKLSSKCLYKNKRHSKCHRLALRQRFHFFIVSDLPPKMSKIKNTWNDVTCKPR